MILRRAPLPVLRPYLAGVTGYAERGGGLLYVRAAASLVVPIILTLRGGFDVALGRAPTAGDRVGSFAAELHPGYVVLASDGSAECVQIGLTPLGARRVLGLFPTFRYRDPALMIEWLERAFGFTTRMRSGEGGQVEHAELAFGSAMIMLGSVRDDDFGGIVGAPEGQGGKSVYVAVDDADALFERAKAAGATIEQGLVERPYGSREFICRDPEGNVWCFGTYWPKADDPA